MKKSIFNLASANNRKIIKRIIIGMLVFLGSALEAQVIVKTNTGSLPSWCPAGQAEAHYYFIPDMGAYYDVHTSMFIYQVKNAWVHKANLPEKYSSYDLNCEEKIMITGNINFDSHKEKYPKVNYAKANNNKDLNAVEDNAVIENPSDTIASIIF